MTSSLDDPSVANKVFDLIQQGETNTSIAKIVSKEFTKVSRDAIRRFRRRHGLQSLSGEFTVSENAASITLQGSYSELNDPKKLIEDRGLDPEDWIIDSARISEWGSADQPYNQLRVNLKRKIAYSEVVPARADGWKAPRRKPVDRSKPVLVVICADQQAPYHNKHLHSLMCSWIAANKPDEGIISGDLCDLPSVSRHKNDPINDARVNLSIQSGYDILRDYVSSNTDTNWKMIPGNHDERIGNYVIEKAPELHGLMRAQQGDVVEESVLSLPFLLRLDELGIEYIDPLGPYQNAQIKLSPLLAVRHGWIAAKGSGTSALNTLKHLGHSVIISHTHRQSLVYQTLHDIDRRPETLVAAETGCLCNIDNHTAQDDGNLAYVVSTDWQNGFLSVMVYPNGTFHIEPGLYSGKKLRWRDQTYS